MALTSYTAPTRAIGQTGLTSDLNTAYKQIEALTAAVLALGSTQTVFTPANADFSENRSTAVDGNGVAQPNATARLFFTTNATSLSLEGANTYDGDVSLLQEDGTLIGSYTMGSGPVAVTLPGAGSRKFYFQMGGAQRTNEVGPVLANGISKITFPAGTTNSIYKPVYTDLIALLGDSITVRGGDFKPSVRSLGPYLRGLALASRSVTMLAYGSRRLANAIYLDADWAITKAAILAATMGGASRTVYIEAGINDYGLGSYTAADLAAKLQARIVELRAADAGLRIVVQTILLTGFEGQLNSNATGANLNSATPAQWRAAFEAIKTNLPYIFLAKGETMISGVNKLVPAPGDGIHPNQAGNDEYFPAVASYFSENPATSGTAVVFNQLNEIVESPAGTWRPTATSAEGYGHTATTNQYLPANTSGRIWSSYYKPTGAGSSALLGVKLSSGVSAFSSFLAAFSVSSAVNGELYVVNSGNGAPSSAYTVTSTALLGIYRDGTTGKLTLQRWNGTAWVDILTFAASTTAPLYLGLDVYNFPQDTTVSGTLVNPRGTGLTV